MLRLLLLLVLFAAGCAGGEAASEMETAPATGGALSPMLEETVAVENGPRITLLEVVSDNRCPADVECITGGAAVVRLGVSLQGRRTETTVSIPGGTSGDRSAAMTFADGATVLGYDVGLIALRPYPGTPEAEAGTPLEAILVVRPAP